MERMGRQRGTSKEWVLQWQSHRFWDSSFVVFDPLLFLQHLLFSLFFLYIRWIVYSAGELISLL